MEPVLLKYIAGKVLEDIRRGRDLDEDLCNALSGYPEIDYLRQVSLPADADRVIALCQSENEPVRSLGFGLLHRLAKNDENVQKFLKNLWEESTDYTIRMKLLWRLLDNPYLDVEIHRSIFSFLQDNYDQFITDTTKWVKDGEVLKYAKDRLRDNQHPESKAWVYLLVASSSGENIDSLLTQHEDSEASIVAEVVEDLKEK